MTRISYRRNYWPDATHQSRLLAIGAATEAIRRAQAEQLEAVRNARANGIPWSWIAEPLGISRQSAHERFGKDTERIDKNTDLPFVSVSSQQNERRDG